MKTAIIIISATLLSLFLLGLWSLWNFERFGEPLIVTTPTATTEPVIQPTVSNNSDHFQFKVFTNFRATKTFVYSWINTTGGASFNQVDQAGTGEISVVLRDAAGNTVSNGVLENNFASSSGTPGNWVIEITLNEFNGVISFTANGVIL